MVVCKRQYHMTRGELVHFTMQILYFKGHACLRSTCHEHTPPDERDEEVAELGDELEVAVQVEERVDVLRDSERNHTEGLPKSG
eukprot:scaffold211346_cov34-Prasinocladus_malaysianus.AAC.1